MEESVEHRIENALHHLLSAERGTLLEAIAKQYDQIVEARARGFSLQTIAAALTREGVPISRNVLHNYLKRISATGRKPKPVAKGDAATHASGSFSASRPKTDVIRQPDPKTASTSAETSSAVRGDVSNREWKPKSHLARSYKTSADARVALVEILKAVLEKKKQPRRPRIISSTGGFIGEDLPI